MATIWSRGDCKAVMIGAFGERRIGGMREVGKFLHLLSLSTSAENEETGGEADSDKD